MCKTFEIPAEVQAEQIIRDEQRNAKKNHGRLVHHKKAYGGLLHLKLFFINAKGETAKAEDMFLWDGAADIDFNYMGQDYTASHGTCKKLGEAEFFTKPNTFQALISKKGIKLERAPMIYR